MVRRVWQVAAVSAALIGALAACAPRPADEGSNLPATGPGVRYSVGGTISGLTGSGLTLSLNSGAQTVSPASGATSYVFATGLVNGATYSVAVTASPSGLTCTVANASGIASGANVTNINVTCSPTPPAGVASAAGYYQNTVTWNADPSLQYNVYWGMQSGIGTASANRAGGVSPPFVHSGLKNGSRYYYVVTALLASVESAASSEVSAMPVPPAPSGINLAAGDAQVTVSWSPVSTANSYNLYWSNSTGVTLATQNRYTGIIGNSKIVTGLTNGTPVYFAVSVIENGVEGPISSQTGGTPQAAAVGVPTGVTAIAGGSSIAVSWNPISGATSYNLYWGNSPGVTKATTNKFSSVTSPYTHASLTAGSTYYYVVTAVVSSVESAASAEVSSTVSAAGWVTKTPLAIGRFGLGVAEVTGIIYAIGGASNSLTSVDAYNPASDTWSSKAPMPTGRAYQGAAAVNGVIYVIGGICCGIRLNTVEAYDPASNTWSTKPSMPTARESPGVVAVNGIIYVIGGGGDAYQSVFTVVEAYDPVSNTWSTKASMPTARVGPAPAVVNGIVYVIGGGNCCGGYLNVVEAYDPASNTWSTKAAMPTARNGLVAATVNGIIYAIGGWDGLNTVEAYDPLSNSWTAKTVMPTGRGYLGVAVVTNRVYAVGGRSSGTELGTVEAYTP